MDQLLGAVTGRRWLEEEVILHLLRLHHISLGASEGAVPRRRVVHTAVQRAVALVAVPIDVLRLIEVFTALGHVLILQ